MSQPPQIPKKLQDLMDHLNAGKLVPAVDPGDLKVLWHFFEDHDLLDGKKALGAGAWNAFGMADKLSHDADLDILQVRVALLAGLRQEGIVKPWQRGTELEDRIFRVAATLASNIPSYPDQFLERLEMEQ
ncbi:MAG TPA: hypothetical protein VL177_01585 [Terriglobales bacterium]|jgi:hypothetical protein|nr:hypothetical protein [Terriglobales bacterium]